MAETDDGHRVVTVANLTRIVPRMKRGKRQDFSFALDHQHTLNERQRDVLRLIALGRTNGQIADQLGMTLDGAKWNVSEILSKLGLTSREEAADFWRQQNALHWRPGRVLGGLPLWSKLAFGAGAAAIVSVLAVLVLTQDSDSAEVPAGVWLAFSPDAQSPENPIASGTLHVANLAGDERIEVARGERYAVVQWSPDGSRLAALTIQIVETDEGPGPVAKVRVWAVPSLQEIATISGGEIAETFVYDFDWSPDSTRLAIFRTGGIDIHDRDGSLIGEVADPAPDGAISISVRDQPWSPDSQYVAVMGNGLLMVADRDGNGYDADLPDTPGFTGFGGMSINGWDPPHTIRLFARDESSTGLLVPGVVASDHIEWGQGTQLDVDDALGFDFALADELEQRFPGTTYRGTFPTANSVGSVTEISTVHSPGIESRAVTLIVDVGEDRCVVSLGEALSSFATGSTPWDVVVSGGWDGSLPAEVDLSGYAVYPSVARTPQPSPSPVATPTPRTPSTELPTATRTPFPSGPDRFTTVIPYPTPRGERVQARVADLPLFPGVEEIDGFVVNRSGADSAVQMYETDARPEDVISFYDAELAAAGFRKGGGGYGVAGEEWDYVRGRDRVRVSTQYIPRPGDEQPRGEQPYGYQGKGRAYLPGNDGKTLFFIVTSRAE